MQSTGGTGFVLLEHLSRLGVGISTLVSFGDKDDVSGTDMLQWWESDQETKLALLYLESIGNPPKFARTARRVGRTMPVLTVAVGRSATGRRLAGSRTAKAATPLVTRQALFAQAGIIAAANLGELLDTAALLAYQPVPAGGRVGVVSNTRGAAVLAADACGDAGLQVAGLAADTRRALRDLLGAEALVAGPVDTTVLVTPGRFRECLELVGADPGVDAVLALTTTTAGSNLVPEVGAARLPVPIAAAVLDQIEVVRLLPGPGHDSPAVPAWNRPGLFRPTGTGRGRERAASSPGCSRPPPPTRPALPRPAAIHGHGRRLFSGSAARLRLWDVVDGANGAAWHRATGQRPASAACHAHSRMRIRRRSNAREGIWPGVRVTGGELPTAPHRA